MPSAYDDGTPTTNDELLVNVAKIYDALIDLREVWDDVRYPELFDKFRSGGAWGKDLAKIELMARRIVAEVRRLHVNGAIAMAFKSDPPLPVKQEDQDFTFSQRIHWVAYLLKHSKRFADLCMTESSVPVRMARIWSLLCEIQVFRDWWNALTQGQRDRQMFQNPYAGTALVHPTGTEQQQLRQRAQARFIELSTPTPAVIGGSVVGPYPGPSAFSFAPQQYPMAGHGQEQSQRSGALGKWPATDPLEAQSGPSLMNKHRGHLPWSRRA
jgi:hypothetical protein